MLPRVVLLSSCLLLVAGVVSAAEIYGQLLDAKKKTPAGAIVSSSCGGQTGVDQYGRYRLTDLPQRTTCALTINHRNLTSNPVNIYTANNRNSANFMLKVSSGRLLLIRR